MKKRQIAINGNIISYRVEGEGKNAIIFLHGWRSEGAAWMPAIAALGPREEKLIVPDMPGFGASHMEKGSMSLGDYADIVRALVVHEAPEGKVVIVGHSFGGRIGVKIAAENQPSLSRLVLVASGGARMDQGKRHIMQFVAKILKPFFQPGFMHGLRDAIYRLIGAEDYIARPEIKETLMNILNEDIEGLLAKIQAPTLVIWGDKDEMAPLAYGKKMARAIPHARLEVMMGTGHWCFRERPEEFARRVEGFLS